MSDDEDDLGGGVDLTLLDKIVNDNAGFLPTGDSADPSSILKPLSGFLSDSIERFGKIADCAFVFATDPERDFGLLPGGRRHSHLIRLKGRTYSPSGRLHMIATGGNRGASSPGGEDEDELVKFLKAKGLSGRPLARYIGNEHVILWYPNGIGQPSLAVEVPVGDAGTADLPAIEKALGIFYDKRCRVPDKAIPFWHDAPKRVPRRFAEKDIQKSLLQTLESVLYKCRVEREPRLRDSEVDFAIYAKHAGRQAALCVIEVKVLREKRWHADAKLAKGCPPSVNRNNLLDGVEQAAFARNELIAPLAVLAAYDMRAKDDPAIMSTVAVTSKANNVECRRYFLYNSKKAYRKANPARAAEA
jgi:hypothetical protein